MTDTARKCAVVLLSGGLDSTTVVAIAQAQGFDVVALSFDYGQRHAIELEAARRVVAATGIRRHEVLKIDLGSFGGSSLTDHDLAVPTDRLPADMEHGIPNTYVPARNTVFLSCALALAEVAGADDIFLGVNALDYSGYPDCRPEYIAAFQAMANLATAATVEGSRRITIHAPLMTLTKSEIIAEGLRLGVDYSLTTSCYQGDAEGACGVCDSCTLRLKGFSEAGADDPVLYRAA